MIEIALRDVKKDYGANPVLKGVTFEVNRGSRAGLLGRNGCGKSTLFRIVAGTEGWDGGDRMVRKGAVVGMLDQIPVFPNDFTALEVLYTVFAEVHRVRNRLTELEEALGRKGDDGLLLDKYGKLLHYFEQIDGYSMEEAVQRVRIGLKIDDVLSATPFVKLSGGEQTRVMLGTLILKKPDILLLDEPTNHLDVASIEWLEGFLEEYPGTVLVISHDRYFLDRVVNQVIELADGKAEQYSGNYSSYALQKEEKFRLQMGAYQQEQKKIKQLETAAKRLHEWAVRADSGALHARAFNIEKRIERMEKTEKPVTERKLKAAFSEYEFSGNDVVVARNIVKAFDGKPVLNGADFIVRKGERVAILGSNGCGKSTLFKCITGELAADSGLVRKGESIKAGYLSQVVEFENPEASILETVRRALKISEGDARNLLAGYRFVKEDVNKQVGNLSGGEKSRLRLCLMMQEEINLLMMDEPTNHLDIHSREWLEDSLSRFNGTIVFISHDRYFINKFADRIALLKDGRIVDFFGGYEYYRTECTRRGL
jgi:ATPase subunit of ABC transporter with duplicated ATPase domains